MVIFDKFRCEAEWHAPMLSACVAVRSECEYQALIGNFFSGMAVTLGSLLAVAMYFCKTFALEWQVIQVIRFWGIS